MGAGDHDDRVVPLHTHKLLATLQHNLCFPDSPQRNPIVSRQASTTAVLHASERRSHRTIQTPGSLALLGLPTSAPMAGAGLRTLLALMHHCVQDRDQGGARRRQADRDGHCRGRRLPGLCRRGDRRQVQAIAPSPA